MVNLIVSMHTYLLIALDIACLESDQSQLALKSIRFLLSFLCQFVRNNLLHEYM